MKKNKSNNEISNIAIYFVVQVVISIIAGIVITAIYGPENTTERINNMAGIISFASLGILCILFIIKYRKKLLEDIKRLRKKDIILVTISAVLLIISNELLTNLLVKLNIAMDNQELVNTSLKSNLIIVTIMTVLFAPIVEEIVFRYSISTLFKKNIPFIIVSSIIFGAMHATNIAIILYSIIGLVLSYVFIKTDKNIIASILVHIANNTFAIISMILLIK